MKLTVSFYDRMPEDLNGNGVPAWPKPIATAGYVAAGTSAAAPDNARFARVCSDTALHVAHGAAATAADPLLPANLPEPFGIGEGQTLTWIAA